MIGAITAGVGALAGGIGGAFAQKAHNDYADVLREIDWDMPDAINQAESILSAMSTQGLPGMAARRGRVEGTLPNTLNQAKKVASSPSDLLGVLSNTNDQISDSLTNLEISDAEAQIGNKQKYAGFLGGEKANAQMLIQNLQNETTMSAAAEEMAGKQELISGIMSGLGAGGTIGAGLEQAGAIKENTMTLNDYLMSQK